MAQRCHVHVLSCSAACKARPLRCHWLRPCDTDTGPRVATHSRFRTSALAPVSSPKFLSHGQHVSSLLQVCFPRVYYAGIASHISAELGARDNDLVVLKLCNRSRAAGLDASCVSCAGCFFKPPRSRGVLIAHVWELEEVLQAWPCMPRALYHAQASCSTALPPLLCHPGLLEDILEPPDDLEAWFRPRLLHLAHAAGDLVDKDS